MANIPIRSTADRSKSELMIPVTAAIIVVSGKILICRRSSGSLAGFWEFPGGKIENGETREECLARELHEELGISIRVGNLIAQSEYHHQGGSILLIGLEAEILSGTPTPTVHDLIEWVSLSTLLTYNLAPADIPIAEAVLKLFV